MKVSELKKVGVGQTAEVFDWKEGWIIKLFNEGIPKDWVEYEQRIACAVASLERNVPEVGDLVAVEKRFGIVYQKVSGISFLEYLKKAPLNAGKIGKQLAALHVELQVHTKHNDIPSHHERLKYKIENASLLTELERNAALEELNKLPDGDVLCHNDFHPDNVIVTDKGPVVIDWVDASIGNPVADVARTLLLLECGTPPEINWFMLMAINAFRKILFKSYVGQYCKLTGTSVADINSWRLVIAAARLSDNLEGEEDFLLSIIKSELGKAKR